MSNETKKPLSLFAISAVCLALGPGMALGLGAATSTVDLLFWCCIPIIGVYFVTTRNEQGGKEHE